MPVPLLVLCVIMAALGVVGIALFGIGLYRGAEPETHLLSVLVVLVSAIAIAVLAYLGSHPQFLESHWTSTAHTRAPHSRMDQGSQR